MCLNDPMPLATPCSCPCAYCQDLILAFQSIISNKLTNRMGVAIQEPILELRRPSLGHKLTVPLRKHEISHYL